ncbi:hypothetical protein MJ588_13580 [Klebsiella pneumoniae]|nr:hypothetical protein MJ588_13580 [Klebsiella pneumoniae]
MSCRCAYSPQPSCRMARNALHNGIIDVFNEFGVQIMSPNFVMMMMIQPKAAVVVPQEAWYAAPAVAPQEPEK